VTTLPARLRVFAQTPSVDTDPAALRAIAEVVLPGEIGADARARVVTSFIAWLHDYRGGADMDHGYGFTRLRRTPPSPAAKYSEQLKGLEARAAGPGFAGLSVDARRVMLEEAIAAAKIDRLPNRPDGGHIATDLMAFYFNGSEAHDRAYRAAIGRDACRGLDGSSERPGRIS
jgi:hypothetical protein